MFGKNRAEHTRIKCVLQVAQAVKGFAVVFFFAKNARKKISTAAPRPLTALRRTAPSAASAHIAAGEASGFHALRPAVALHALKPGPGRKATRQSETRRRYRRYLH